MTTKENKLWEELCTVKGLEAGWHLTRSDAHRDFVQEPYSKEVFGYFKDDYIGELLRLLQTGSFSPSPLKRISIPKGPLGTRPGTVLSIEDRVVLFSALKLIAKPLDGNLSDSVYSYRVKENVKKNSLFCESDAISIPFLKDRTIKKYVDPIDSWYSLWPKFDEESKSAFKDLGYSFMATSDIAAYFENIQLDLLREQLVSLLPSELKIVNLFMTSFAEWTYSTEQGKRHLRGIPQGTQISSFFGNLFLRPIDNEIERSFEGDQIKYYRYMDDIRIFTKNFNVARSALLLLDKQIRKLHLNLQTAKTKIFDEKQGEITANLIDYRLSHLDDIEKKVRQEIKISKNEGRDTDFNFLIEEAGRLVKQEPPENSDGTKIEGARRPLRGLTDRVFRRYLQLHLNMGSNKPVNRLLKEIELNADHRLGIKLISYCRKFPRLLRIQTTLLKFLKNNESSLFPYQEAQMIEALRYQSRVTDDLLEYVRSKLSETKLDPFVSIQSLRLIARCKLRKEDLELGRRILETSEDIGVRKAAALILVRTRGEQNNKLIRSLVFHSNNELRKYGRLLWSVKSDENKSKHFVDQCFKIEYLMVDIIPLLFLMTQSGNNKVISVLVNKIKEKDGVRRHINMDMRDCLKEIVWLGNDRLASLRKTSN